MIDVKEVYIEAQEELIEEYFEKNPMATYEQAFEAIEHKIYDRYLDKWTTMIDQVHMILKDRN